MWMVTSIIIRLALEITFQLNKYFFLQVAYESLSESRKSVYRKLSLIFLMQIYDVSSLIKEPTFFQSHSPTGIDSFLTNHEAMFKFRNCFQTGLSDHRKIISVVMNPGIFRRSPQKKVCRSYKNFDLEHFSIA